MREGYKDSTLGEIPEDWDLVKLASVAEFSNGKGHEQFIDEAGDFIVVNSKFISTDGRVIKKSNQNLCPLNTYDIVMVMSDIPNGKAISKCFVIDSEDKYTLNQRICSLKAKSNIDYKFLYYVINRNRYYLAFDNGVGQTNLKKDEVLCCPIQLPPLPEQNKIAKILSTVDDKIDVIDQQIAENTELKKGLMQKLLTKGIGHTKYKDSSLGEIPESWEVVKLGEVAKTFAGGTPKRNNSGYYNGDIPWVKSGEVNQRNILFTSELVTRKAIKETATRLISKDSVLIALYGATAGNVGMLRIEACSNQAVLSVNSINGNLTNDYIYHYLKLVTNKLIGYSQGSGQPNLSKGIIDSVSLPLPPIEEQQKLAFILSTVDDKLEVLKDKKSEYQELKKGLMQNLLTGKVRVF